MPMSYAEVSRKELKFLDLTSLTVEEFQQLLPVFEKEFRERMKHFCLDGKPRVGRGYRTYSNCPLPTPEDRLLFILVYLKNNPLQVMQGELFGMPQNKANQWIHTLLPVLLTTMRSLGDAPARSLEELAQQLSHHVVLDSSSSPFDASHALPDASTPSSQAGETSLEQTRPEGASSPLFAMMEQKDVFSAPFDQDEQKNYYSGKKKYHAVKNVLLVDKQHKIQYLSETHPGKVHDKRVVDATPYPLPHGSVLLQDLGFLGFTLEGVTIEMPTKKPKGRALTDDQKAANQAKARRRVCIEHVNSSVKRLRILKDVCRLLISGIRDMIIEIGCAFHNLRLRLHPWLPIPESE